MRLAFGDALTSNEQFLEIRLDARGSFFLECLAEHLADQAPAWNRLRQSIGEALDSTQGENPAVVRLHLTM